MIRSPTPSETRDRPPDPTDAEVYVLGDGVVGAEVTRRLLEDDHSVALIDGSPGPGEFPANRVEPTDRLALADASTVIVATVIVATSSDSRNLLAAQLIRSRFDVEGVLVVANDPARVDVFADAGHDPVCATTALTDAIVDHA